MVVYSRARGLQSPEAGYPDCVKSTTVLSMVVLQCRGFAGSLRYDNMGATGLGAGFSEPSPRWAPYAAAVGDQVILQGGRTVNFDKNELLSRIHTLDVYEESWRERTVKGPAPPGLYEGACTSTPSGHTLHAYGGWNGSLQSFQGSLHQLDINSLNWTQLTTPDSSISRPMNKTGCGMVAYNDQLILFGGWTDGYRYTNMVHVYDFQKGEAVHIQYV